MAHPEKGLPMTAKWDPAKLAAEVAALEELERQPFLRRVGGYLRRAGPGLLQSAMTLGAGSATASVIAGASFGYKLLWIQPLAMFLGVMMMAAIGNIVLTTGERPYVAFGRELSRVLVFLWALGTIVASVIWHFPQYGLVAGAARDLAQLFGVATREGGSLTAAGVAVSVGAGVVILGVNVMTTWSYGSSARGIKLYEWFLRGVIALTIVAFGLVVAANLGKIQWGEMLKGFTGQYGIPAVDRATAEAVLAACGDPKMTVDGLMDSTTLVLGMLGAAVGINMTFLYPYSLLAKGWGKAHRPLSRWDLGLSMFLPFVLVTSLVMLAMTVSGVYRPDQECVRSFIQPVQAAGSLNQVMGDRLGRVVFDLGLIGMACGAISAHMVVCGFTVCEMFGLEYTTRRFRIFAMVPAVGILGVVTQTPMWFPIMASAICFTMLPIAYLMFLILNNKRSYIGDAVGRGWRRVAFNAVLVLALAVATIGSVIKVKGGVIDKLLGGEKPAAGAPAAK